MLIFWVGLVLAMSNDLFFRFPSGHLPRRDRIDLHLTRLLNPKYDRLLNIAEIGLYPLVI